MWSVLLPWGCRFGHSTVLQTDLLNAEKREFASRINWQVYTEYTEQQPEKSITTSNDAITCKYFILITEFNFCYLEYLLFDKIGVRNIENRESLIKINGFNKHGLMLEYLNLNL